MLPKPGQIWVYKGESSKKNYYAVLSVNYTTSNISLEDIISGDIHSNYPFSSWREAYDLSEWKPGIEVIDEQT